jgi:hypothetical protein
MAHEGNNADQPKKVEEDAADNDIQHQPSSENGLYSGL